MNYFALAATLFALAFAANSQIENLPEEILLAIFAQEGHHKSSAIPLVSKTFEAVMQKVPLTITAEECERLETASLAEAKTILGGRIYTNAPEVAAHLRNAYINKAFFWDSHYLARPTAEEEASMQARKDIPEVLKLMMANGSGWTQADLDRLKREIEDRIWDF